jgi:multiple sugar transport system permease protein
MQPSPSVTAKNWETPISGISPARRSSGRLLIGFASLLLVGLVIIQCLETWTSFQHGFVNWRPVLYAYVFWAVALGAGLVLTRGEHGHRALFVLPAVLFTVSMVIFPTIFGLYIAFTDWNLSSLQGRHFSGLDNVRTMIHDRDFWKSMINMIWYVLAVLAQYVIAFGLALLLNADIVGRKFFRVAFLLPFMLSPVAVSWMIGKSIMDLRFGPASWLFRQLGWESPAFFVHPWTARAGISAMDAWIWIPFIMIMLLAGLQALPTEIMESARVDGATGWKSFWQMTFPLMLPVSVTAVVLRIIFELKLADLILNVTGGGPGGATDSVSSFIYREYNTQSNVGYGTLLAEFYLVVIIVFMTVLLALIGRWMRKVT